MKKIINIILMTLITIIILMTVFTTEVNAIGTFDDVKGKADSWIKRGEQGVLISPEQAAGVMLPVAKILVSIGVAVLVIVTTVMGIKYMMTDDPKELAKLKKQLIGLVVSAVVIFGAYQIWSLVYSFMNEITS